MLCLQLIEFLFYVSFPGQEAMLAGRCHQYLHATISIEECVTTQDSSTYGTTQAYRGKFLHNQHTSQVTGLCNMAGTAVVDAAI